MNASAPTPTSSAAEDGMPIRPAAHIGRRAMAAPDGLGRSPRRSRGLAEPELKPAFQPDQNGLVDHLQEDQRGREVAEARRVQGSSRKAE